MEIENRIRRHPGRRGKTFESFCLMGKVAVKLSPCPATTKRSRR
jgi:hypothetical protein